MIRKAVFGLAIAIACLSIGTTTYADPPGKAKGHHKDEWKEHGHGPPVWAPGEGNWSGRYWNNYGSYQAVPPYWSYRVQPYYYTYPEAVPYGWVPPPPHPYYDPAPYGQGWGFEGSIRVYPQPGW